MNMTAWWHHFCYVRLAEKTIVIEPEEERAFRLWLSNFDGMHFDEPVKLKDPRAAIYRIVDEQWLASLRGRLIYGLPIYHRTRVTSEETATYRERWVLQETPVDVSGYIREYGRHVRIVRTGEAFTIVSLIPLQLPKTIIR
ncbi:hypothetical protein [uncultured Microbacterium sp.]|uniref:hypothetical protein n=1 Tax=uncultured Microbacterium sp. TaxID=191216 RepID=UPI0025F1A5A8|nr:hypothetical protein [uncultured Microbacterium sp.]